MYTLIKRYHCGYRHTYNFIIKPLFETAESIMQSRTLRANMSLALKRILQLEKEGENDRKIRGAENEGFRVELGPSHKANSWTWH